MTDLQSGYADGWNTRGWTSQDANLPNATPGSPSWYELGLPDGMTGLPITGKWYDQYGPAWGNLLFTPSVSTVVVNGVEVEFSPYRVYLQDGQLPEGLAVPVPTSGTYTDPGSWVWNVTGRVGPKTVSYSIPVPSSSNPFDLIADSGSAVDTSLPLVRAFTVAQGATFVQSYNWDGGGVDGFTGWTAHMQIRDHVGGTVVVDLTDVSGITLDSSGNISITVTAEQTAALAPATYVFDLFMYDAGTATQFLTGTFQVTAAVTT